jgi:hypothetical protein
MIVGPLTLTTAQFLKLPGPTRNRVGMPIWGRLYSNPPWSVCRFRPSRLGAEKKRSSDRPVASAGISAPLLGVSSAGKHYTAPKPRLPFRSILFLPIKTMPRFMYHGAG